MFAVCMVFAVFLIAAQVSIYFLYREAKRYINLKYEINSLQHNLRKRYIRRALWTLSAGIQSMLVVVACLLYYGH